jgi:hypothetical protein
LSDPGSQYDWRERERERESIKSGRGELMRCTAVKEGREFFFLPF